jgi:hypothetical protein
VNEPEKGTLYLQFLTRSSLEDLDLGRALFDLLRQHAPRWLPEVWGTEEPARNPWDPDQLDRIWAEERLLFESAEPEAAVLEVRKRGRGLRTHGNVRVRARPDSVAPDSAVHLFRESAMRLDADYGHLHLAVPEDVGELYGVSEHQGQVLFSVPDWSLQFFLPGVFWAMIFGPSYAQMFGTEAIRTCPAHVVEELEPGRWYLQLTPSLMDNLSDRESVVSARWEIMDHLGRDAFWRPEYGRPIHPRQGRPKPPGRAPRFDDLRTAIAQ